MGKFIEWQVKLYYSSISIFPRLFEWLLLVSPTLTSVWVPLWLLRPFESEFTGLTYSSLSCNPLFLRASSYIILLSLIFLAWECYIYPLVHGIRNLLQYRSCVVRVNIYVGGGLLLLKGLKVPLFKLSVKSRKSTIFKFEAISICRSSNLNALLLYFRVVFDWFL